MSSERRLSWFLGAALWMIASANLAGCASTPPPKSTIVDGTGMTQPANDLQSIGQPEPGIWQGLRSAAHDLYEAGFSFNLFLTGPVRSN